jgi:Protein of unknown function (DUF1573)
MQKVIATLAAALFVSVLLFGSAVAQVIHLDKTTHDFGKMNQKESRDTEVVVTNNGGGILIIEEVNADCGCTVPTLEKQQLTPGESTVIKINFDSKEFHGNVLKMIHILSNDPNSPDTEFSITADVFAPVIVNPATKRIGFSQAPAGNTFTKQVTFTATETNPLEIRVGKTRKGLFEVSTINGLDGNPKVSALVVTVPKDMPAGRQFDVARVYTNIEGVDHVDIDMTAWPTLALRSSVDQINFRYKKDFTKKFLVYPFENGLEYTITKVECDVPGVEVTFDTQGSKTHTTIMVSGSPLDKSDPRAQEKNGRMTGNVLIHTNLENLPVMEIPLSYMIRM